MDFDKLKTIDDWENLGIDYRPVSHKDWTIQDLLIARDKLNTLISAIPDSQKYSMFNKDALNSDHVRLLLLRSAFEDALADHRRNTALWSKDPYLNELTSKPEDYDGNTYIGGSSSPEQIQDLEKEFGTQGDNSDTGTPYQSREDVPESARELWDIMHNDEAINSMRRGM